MLPFVVFDADQFAFTHGRPTEFRSSPSVTRTFCGRCGSPLTYRTADQPDRIDIMTCTLDDPDVTPPTFHVWVSHKLAWVRIADELSAYVTTRTAGHLVKSRCTATGEQISDLDR